MNTDKIMRNQNGAALVIVLVLLATSLMLGLSSTQSSLIEERLAGNYKAAAQAQMNAERAAAHMWNEFGKYASSPASDPEGNNFGLVDGFGWREFKDLAEGLSSCLIFKEDTELPSAYDGVACYLEMVDFTGVDGTYIVAMGALNNGDVAASEPVFVRVDKSSVGSFASTSVLGGLKEGALKLPSSENSRLAGGVYTEGDEVFEVNAFMLDEGMGGYTIEDVIAEGERAGLDEYNASYYTTKLQSRLDFLHQLYQKHLDTGGNQISENGKGGGNSGICSGLCFYEEGLSVTGNQTLEGVHIVINGEAQVGGNSDIQGVLIVLNIENSAHNASQWKLNNVNLTEKLKLNGGGNKGTVWFNEDAVRESLFRVDITLDEFFRAGSQSNEARIVSWQ